MFFSWYACLVNIVAKTFYISSVMRGKIAFLGLLGAYDSLRTFKPVPQYCPRNGAVPEVSVLLVKVLLLHFHVPR